MTFESTSLAWLNAAVAMVASVIVGAFLGIILPPIVFLAITSGTDAPHGGAYVALGLMYYGFFAGAIISGVGASVWAAAMIVRHYRKQAETLVMSHRPDGTKFEHTN